MNEFSFLEEKRKTSGLTPDEEQHWHALGTSLGYDLTGLTAQPQGYYGEDGVWYQYPPGYDPQAAWQQPASQPNAEWDQQQQYYPPQPQDPSQSQGWYDPNTGAWYPTQPAPSPYEAPQQQWADPNQGWAQQQQSGYDPNAGAYYPPQQPAPAAPAWNAPAPTSWDAPPAQQPNPWAPAPAPAAPSWQQPAVVQPTWGQPVAAPAPAWAAPAPVAMPAPMPAAPAPAFKAPVPSAPRFVPPSFTIKPKPSVPAPPSPSAMPLPKPAPAFVAPAPKVEEVEEVGGDEVMEVGDDEFEELPPVVESLAQPPMVSTLSKKLTSNTGITQLDAATAKALAEDLPLPATGVGGAALEEVLVSPPETHPVGADFSSPLSDRVEPMASSSEPLAPFEMPQLLSVGATAASAVPAPAALMSDELETDVAVSFDPPSVPAPSVEAVLADVPVTEVARSSFDAPAEVPLTSFDAPAEMPHPSFDGAADAPVASFDAPAEVPLASFDAPAEVPLASFDAPAEVPLASFDAPAEVPLASFDAPPEVPLASFDTPAEVPLASVDAVAAVGVESFGAPADTASFDSPAAPAEPMAPSDALAGVPVGSFDEPAPPVVNVEPEASVLVSAEVYERPSVEIAAEEIEPTDPRLDPSAAVRRASFEVSPESLHATPKSEEHSVAVAPELFEDVAPPPQRAQVEIAAQALSRSAVNFDEPSIAVSPELLAETVSLSNDPPALGDDDIPPTQPKLMATDASGAIEIPLAPIRLAPPALSPPMAPVIPAAPAPLPLPIPSFVDAPPLAAFSPGIEPQADLIIGEDAPPEPVGTVEVHSSSPAADFAASADPVLDATVEPMVEATVEPLLDATVEPLLDATVEPVLEATVEPMVDASVAVDDSGWEPAPVPAPAPPVAAFPPPRASGSSFDLLAMAPDESPTIPTFEPTSRPLGQADPARSEVFASSWENEPIELGAEPDAPMQLASPSDFMSTQPAVAGNDEFSVDADPGEFVVESATTAELATNMRPSAVGVEAPVEKLELASNSDFIDHGQLTSTGGQWSDSRQALALELPAVEGEEEVIQGVDEEVVQGTVLEEEPEADSWGVAVSQSSPGFRDPGAPVQAPAPVVPPPPAVKPVPALVDVRPPAPAPVVAPLGPPPVAAVVAAAPSARTPVGVPGEHRVILHTVEGQVKRGAIKDAKLGEPQLQLHLANGGSETLARERVKALFFMLAPGVTAPPTRGSKVRVTFKDGRQVAGFSADHTTAAAGFFVVPADNRTNTERIFIFHHAVQTVVVEK